MVGKTGPDFPMIGKNFRRFSNDWKKIRGSGLQIPLCEFTAVIPRPPDRFNRVATQGGNRPHRGVPGRKRVHYLLSLPGWFPPLHRRSRGSATLPPGTPRGGTRFRASAVANWRHNGAVRRRSRVPARAKGRAANPHATHGESHGFRPTPMRVAPHSGEAPPLCASSEKRLAHGLRPRIVPRRVPRVRNRKRSSVRRFLRRRAKADFPASK